jgi:DNA-binding LacI/PurR family transcriptional regulator/DNA-binding transcriptional regulator YhcF (GntR family)
MCISAIPLILLGVTHPMIPFTVERHSPLSLTDQIAGGFRRAIEVGHYQAGDVLPTLKETAAELAVSLDVVRTAIGRLSQDGVVTARPRRGIEVCPREHFRWQAHVLYLSWSSATSYYDAVSSEALLRHLLARRILGTAVHLSYEDVERGCPVVASVLRAGPVALAVVCGSARQCDALLARHGIPFIHVIGEHDPEVSPLARQLVLQGQSAAQTEAMRHCRACGLTELLVMSSGPGDPPIVALAAQAGLRVCRLAAPPAPGCGLPEAVERGGMQAMTAWLAQGHRLPQAIYFADDYLAQGALTALLAAGVRIPDQVQVITHANRNLGPVFPLPLTRVELDPVGDGQLLARLVLELLSRPARRRRRVVSAARFIPGATTRPHSPIHMGDLP